MSSGVKRRSIARPDRISQNQQYQTIHGIVPVRKQTYKLSHAYTRRDLKEMISRPDSPSQLTTAHM